MLWYQSLFEKPNHIFIKSWKIVGSIHLWSYKINEIFYATYFMKWWQKIFRIKFFTVNFCILKEMKNTMEFFLHYVLFQNLNTWFKYWFDEKYKKILGLFKTLELWKNCTESIMFAWEKQIKKRLKIWNKNKIKIHIGQFGDFEQQQIT